jgi:hypothetical protein
MPCGTTEQRISNAQLTFTLRDFTVGKASDIVNRKATDFVSPVVDKKLQTDTGRANYVYGPPGHAVDWFTPHVRWEPAKPDEHDRVLTMTFNELYEEQWEQKRPAKLWQTCASYLVTVTFQGETRGPYKALFFFGREGKGNEVVQPYDAVADTHALAYSIVRSSFRRPIRGWPDARR